MGRDPLSRGRTQATHSFALILTTTIAALACGYSLMTDDSVRFNTERKGRGFYRLPPLPIMYDKTTGRELSTRQMSESYTFEDEQLEIDGLGTTSPDVDERWNSARTAVDNGDLNEARELLQGYLESSDVPMLADVEEQTRQPRRNAARDMLDAMSALDHGSRRDDVKSYLDARYRFDLDPTVRPEDITAQSPDKSLRDNWDYLHAAALYRRESKDRALVAFKTHAEKYPRSEKHEAVLYMIAKLQMESSYSYGNLKCGIVGRDWYGKESDPEPVEKCNDESRRLALDSFKQLMQKYPNGRYFNDARGWLAYLHRRGGERAEALAEYYRLLGHPTDWSVRLEAKKSLQMIGHGYDDAVLDKTEELISPDPNAAMAYAYHRIYNHAVDFTYEEKNSWCCWGDDRWLQESKEEESVKTAAGTGRRELERVARFATAMMKRHSQARVSGGFVLRIAEAQLELQNFAEALSLARKAIGLGVQGLLREQALWVKGSAEHQLKKLDDARRTFEQLVSEFPKSKLVEGSRRLLAMIAEDRGDLESALEHYIALDYESDVAYFIDVYLPTDRLAKFIADRPHLALHNKLLYALGVRFMREKRWEEARGTLRQVRTESGIDRFTDADKSTTWHFAKEPNYDDEKLTYIKTSWVMQDLKTIDVLEHYEQAVTAAASDEAKAEAMYQLASAYFEADDLTFYNPAAWEGTRVGLLSSLQFSDDERAPNESRTIFEHLIAHDPWARSIPIYEEIAARFPKSQIAPDALYSAAVAHERLADRNGVWNEVYEKGLFAGPRMLTYADVKNTFPHYQLPRGTYGWRPSTRTVNGGPGWAAPPKPKPREPREQKIKRLLREAADSISTKFLPTIEKRASAGIVWYESAIEAALYGIASGIALWAFILIGIHLHLRRSVPDPSILGEEKLPPGADSRVDKMIG